MPAAVSAHGDGRLADHLDGCGVAGPVFENRWADVMVYTRAVCCDVCDGTTGLTVRSS